MSSFVCMCVHVYVCVRMYMCMCVYVYVCVWLYCGATRMRRRCANVGMSSQPHDSAVGLRI